MSYRVISDSPAVSAYAPASLLPSFPAIGLSYSLRAHIHDRQVHCLTAPSSRPSAYPAPLTKPFAAQALTASNQDQPSSTLPRSPFCLSACPLPPSFAPLLQPPPPPQLQKAVPPPSPLPAHLPPTPTSPA